MAAGIAFLYVGHYPKKPPSISQDLPISAPGAQIALSRLTTPEILSIGIALVSVGVSVGSVFIARGSFSLARQMADRQQTEWKEQEWIDLYLKANEVYELLDRFRLLSESWTDEELQREWNELMRGVREAHATAVVFPITAVVDAFLKSTAVFRDERVVSAKALSKVFEAVELIREKAQMHPTVLD